MNDRIRQIIEYYGISVRAFEQKIFCTNGIIYKGLARNSDFGASIIAKIVHYCPEISPDWLLLGKGKMLRQDFKKAPMKPYATDEDTPMPMASEAPAPYRTAPVHHAPASDGPSWERYNEALIEIGTLRERLSRASVTIATLQQQLTTEREKTPSTSATTDTVVTLV